MSYIITSGKTSEGIVCENDSLTVLEGGVANNTTVNEGGRMIVDGSGVATGVTVSAGGIMTVSNGGTATDIFLYDDSIFNLDLASATYVRGTADRNGNKSFEAKDGELSDFWFRGGIVNVASGGVLSKIKMTGGYWNYELDNIDEYNGTINISNGATANSITFDMGGQMFVASGGEANTVRFYMGGAMTVQGIASDIEINDSCELSISSGGTVSKLSVNGMDSFLYVKAGGTVNSATIGMQANAYIDEGSVAKDVFVQDGSLYIKNGGKLTAG